MYAGQPLRSMTRTRKPASRTRRRSPAARPASRLYRFFRALFVSSIVSFGAATIALGPKFSMSPADPLGRLGWPHQTEVAALPGDTAEVVQTRFSDCPEFFPPGRMPAVPARSGLRELCFSSFAILHNGQTKTPVVVAERLNRAHVTQAQGLQRTDKFYAEARLPVGERAELTDYRGSGYSRGHMAPAGDMASAEGMAQSFSLANMVPQDQKHNAGAWSRIEQDTRKYALRAAGDVYVLTGPVYSAKPEHIGRGVAVPQTLFKVVYDATTHHAWVHWQDNNSATKAQAPISYAEFVERTGMQLLPSSAR
ncbi:DNA/RNA non-specific endonuclease family protein [Bordetella holmesii 30539]|uniref:DNA/RNA non-specific endonuclease n=3 Tax=Bordetella holmesii TaxID=35814 RepID=A0A158MAA7_9BORD|nr:DNA/RNA non-specific endonuclease family protein [Bordetella holmesii ATCC 51541]AIT27404.1 DNA/RNA non-specific endonuclease family protein [Bordetella holmesii 44057]EWM42887.1 DNA/RNA non-specific endonuclease family protein [Bordetella holmesii 41130]EWM47996.1 DNA/RNA non-specific endonuclease family protein [Bordetella holmesii 35009]EXF87440.1 DNA/RNA non-specific endonuclease family protein [Bordetella holmesii 30539]EXX93445.1 DNA/RNA non-specific endonuclease family protein [Borde